MTSDKTKSLYNRVTATDAPAQADVTRNSEDNVVESLEKLSTSISIEQAYREIIPVRTAIKALAMNVSKCPVRIFTTDGKEVIGGSLWNLFHKFGKNTSQAEFLTAIESYWSLYDEFAINLVTPKGSTRPIALETLNPSQLTVLSYKETQYGVIPEVWCYTEPTTGRRLEIRNDYLLFEAGFNPSSQRGYSPALTADSEINVYHQVGKYTKQFFSNSAIPSHLLVLPTGTTQKQAEAIAKQYYAGFNWIGGNAWRVQVVVGDKTRIEPIAQPVPSLDLIALRGSSTDEIMSLFGVPPLVGGLFSKTRFDSADEELQTFYDNTLTPDVIRISNAFQNQIVNVFDWSSDLEISKDQPTIHQHTENVLNEVSNRSRSNLIVVLDLDASPIVARMQKHRVELAAILKQDLLLTPNEAMTFAGLDIPPDKDGVRDRIWAVGNIHDLTDQIRNPRPDPVPVTDKEDPEKPEEPEEAEQQITQEDRDFSRKVSRLYLDLRMMILGKLKDGKNPYLKDFDSVIRKTTGKNDYIKSHSRQIFKDIVQIIRDSDNTEFAANAIRDYFNSIKNKRQIQNIAMNARLHND